VAPRHPTQVRVHRRRAAQKKELLARLAREQQAPTRPNVNVLDDIPHCDIDLTRLPDDQQRRIYDAFHLEIRYNIVRNEAIIRVTVTSGIAPALAATVGKSVHGSVRNFVCELGVTSTVSDRGLEKITHEQSE
jgi:hypothetical protein